MAGVDGSATSVELDRERQQRQQPDRHRRALFYLGHDDRFRPYVSPRFAYGRQRSTSELESPTGRPAAGPETTSSSYAFAGSLGTLYVVGTRVGLFGDAGVEYVNQESSGTVGALGVDDSDTVGMRTSVGVIIYF